MRVLLLCASCALLGCMQSTSSSSSGTGDRDEPASEAAKIPTDQHENPQDVKTTADIRSRIVDAKISISGQNVKVITQGGNVTLRGVVKSEDEKKLIEGIANDVAGVGKVESFLEIETNP